MIYGPPVPAHGCTENGVSFGDCPQCAGVPISYAVRVKRDPWYDPRNPTDYDKVYGPYWTVSLFGHGVPEEIPLWRFCGEMEKPIETSEQAMTFFANKLSALLTHASCEGWI